MHSRRRDVETWVNPEAWADRDQAERAIVEILACGSDDEADWVRIAGGSGEEVAAAADRDFDAADRAMGAAEHEGDQQRAELAQLALRRAEASAEVARLGSARAVAVAAEQAVTEELKAAVRAASSAGVPEETIAALAGASRGSVRRWLGK